MSVRPPKPLPDDYASRLELLGDLAEESGHTDIRYLVEMAVQIARQRTTGQSGRLFVDSDRLPGGHSNEAGVSS